MEWMKLYKKLVNTDTGFELSVQEKLENTEFIANILRELGMNVKKGKASHIATIGRPPYITLIGHLDTVFKRGEPERRPFTVEGNVVKGPGVADMKGGVVILIEVLKKALEEYGDPPIAVVLNVDEEIGSPEGRFDHYEMAERSSFCLSFETGRKNEAVVIQRKGIASLDVKIVGKSGHASNPSSGANALLEMAYKVIEINSLSKRGLTVTPTIFHSGYKGNVIPDEAEAFFDVRYETLEQIKELRLHLEDVFHSHRVPGCVASYSLEIRRPPMRTLPEAEEILQRALDALGWNLEALKVGGGGDAAFYTERGVPAIDGLGVVGNGIHSPEEVAYLDTIPRRIELALKMIEEILG